MNQKLLYAIVIVMFLLLFFKTTIVEKRLKRDIANAIIATRESKESVTRFLQVEYEIKGNSAYASEAMQMAEKAIQNHDIELGKIYILNAINHLPHEIKYYEEYFKLLVNESSTVDDLKIFADILDMAVFQVDPSNVQHVVSMKDNIIQIIAKLEGELQVQEKKRHKEDMEKKILSLNESSLTLNKILNGTGMVDVALLSHRIEIIKEIIEDGMLNESDNRKWQDELNKANIVYQIVMALNASTMAINKVQSITDIASKQELIIAQNQLQTAGALLSQVWTLDCSIVPELLAKAQNIQNRIGELDSKIRKIGSKTSYENSKQIIANIERQYTARNSFTYRIKEITVLVEQLKMNISEISSNEMQRKISDAVNKANEYMQELSKRRYIAYQKWALGCLKDCHKKYESYKVISDKDGNELFNEYLLDINPALLSYDMQSLYNSIYQKVYSEVEDKAASQITKAGHVCKSLEDF